MRQFKTNNQGDVKLEYDPRPADKITGFYAMSTAYDGRTAVLAITFPGPNHYPTKVGGANWVHIFSPADRELGACRLYAHGLGSELSYGYDRAVRNFGECQGRHSIP